MLCTTFADVFKLSWTIRMNNLTRERSLRMRGAAIFLIFLHNLLHLLNYVKENEFAYLPIRAEKMLASFSSLSSSIVGDFFSYLGWYGVPVFIFFSGYGLVMKHEQTVSEKGFGKQPRSLRIVPYLWRNFLKLFVLMAPCYLIYVLGTGQTLFSILTMSQLTMTINLLFPQMISPGVYWYFGLTLQLYIIYLAFFHFRSKRFLMIAALLMMALGVVFEFFFDKTTNIDLRHNSPVWLPVFLAGVWYAREKSIPGLALVKKHWGKALLLLIVLWVWSAVNAYLWTASPLLVLPIFAIICICCCEIPVASGRWAHAASNIFSRCLTYLGSISAGLFVCHPIIRELALKGYHSGYNIVIVTLAYAIVCICVAHIYNYCYKKAMRFLLPKR